MEEYILVGTECEETGELGLIVRGMHTSNFSDGDIFVMGDAVGIAHDLTEHVNGMEEIGTVFDEFQALGGIWYTRGQFGELRRDRIGSAYGPDENVASDIIRMADIAIWHGTGGRLNEEPDETNADGTFEWMIEHSRPKLFEDMLSGEDTTQSEFCKEHEFDIEDYLQQALWGMKLGWIKQEERFPQMYDANNRFWNIHDAVVGVFRNLEWEGQEYKLTIDGDNEARCFEHYEDDDEEQLA